MGKLLHYVWKYRLFPKNSLTTTAGESVEVLDAGQINRADGPEFLNARIRIGETLWSGHVGVHDRSSEWWQHGCDRSPVYEAIVLHVVGEVDAVITRSDGFKIPQLLLVIPAHLRNNYEFLKQAQRRPSCGEVVASLPALKVHSWLSALTHERFEQKTEAIRARLLDAAQDWETAFFVTLARNFGFGINGDAFEQWAQSIPLSALAKHRNDLLQIEALFFGQSGLLEGEMPDAYSSCLQKEYHYLKHKFSLHPVSVFERKPRMRSGNFPHLRLAQLSRLYHEKQALFSLLLEAEEPETLFQLLQVTLTGYWETHYRFGAETAQAERKMSLSSLRLVVINTVIPFLYAYGIYRNNESLKDRATRFLETIVPEENYIIRHWRGLGLRPENAADTQALLQLTRAYCEKRGCLLCRFGYEFIKREPEKRYPEKLT